MTRRIVGALLTLIFTISCDNIRKMDGASVNALSGESTPQEERSPSMPSVAPPPSPARQNIRSFGAKADRAGPKGAPEAMDEKSEEAGLGLVGSGAGGGAIGHGVGGLGMKSPAKKSKVAEAEGGKDGDTGGGDGSLEAAPTRSWFPESFLFEPLVLTNAQGEATLEVPVPDRLTSWRVLALGHTRGGAQAGAVTSFLGTLPAYVDPVVPPFLIAGDRVRLPIQLVNTTDSALSMTLKVDALGGELTGGSGKVAVGPGGSTVQYAQLLTHKPGSVSLQARFGDADAIARSIPVLPSGQPVTVLKGGTLAATRTLEITTAPDLEKDATRVRLLVFPGALGVLRSELSASTGRGSVADDGYTLLLAGKAPQLLSALGDKPNTEVLRGLSLIAGQRVLREARSPNVATAALLGEAALAHPGNPVLARLGERLTAQVAGAQRPDGTFQGGNGWTLQRLLVVTAQCTAMVRADTHDDRAKQRAAGVTIKASGAFERNVSHILDGYTAAAVLATGAVPVSLQPKLRALVRSAVVVRPDGSRVLTPAKGMQRPDGEAPTEMEATALAALALEGDTEAPWRADLGSALLGSYSPGSGWGDGHTNLVALRAVLALFAQPMPKSVNITLALDGQPVAHGELSGEAIRDVLALDADVADVSGPHTWTVQADPAVPGLGFSLGITGYVPWKPQPMNGGLELEIAHASHAKVGEPIEVTVTAAAPANQPLRLRHALPAGMEAESESLAKLVTDGTISAFHTEPGAVILELPARPANTPIHASYRLIATLAGSLHAQASTLEATQRPGSGFHLPPVAWAIE
jgi:hypothetical protein